MRNAIANDPNDYRLWYRLAYIATGPLRQRAIARTRRLNPLVTDLPSAGR
jgi:hypothetical protein